MLWAQTPRSTAAYDEIHTRGTCCDKQGYFTLDEWRTGLKALRADSISKLKKAFPELVQECNFADHFHMFINPGYKVIQFLGFLHICISLLPHRYEDKKKCIEIPVACELLNLVLGLQFRPQVDKLNNYLMYQNDYKVITMDQWMGFIRFCNEIYFPSLDNYDSDLAWPLILDNFVEWLRENKS
ncbi:DCN1-like protein 4 [Zea mays]|uniref:Defective in cullin neddylation protein n=3 Tax=Zea mays TaxID=4577 RepID=A0A1D6HL21_MAIZE|nr:Defective in cullin neddylation protein [Zea mays]PWZ24731.1 DCN1-like protein 4 [Zea mays]